jgi:hypothetical protein
MSICFAADEPEQSATYGKTNAEILAMGQQAWFEYYTDPARGGESTAGMADALGLFAAAARERNDALPQQPQVTALRTQLTDFGREALDLAYNMSGGGTIWIPMYSQMACDVEDVIYGLLGGKVPRVAPATTGQVRRGLVRLAAAAQAEHADEDAAIYFHYDDALASLAALQAEFAGISALAAHFDRSGSDRILQFCLSWVDPGGDMREN